MAARCAGEGTCGVAAMRSRAWNGSRATTVVSIVDEPARLERAHQLRAEAELLGEMRDRAAPAHRLEQLEERALLRRARKIVSRWCSEGSSRTIVATRIVFADGVGARSPVSSAGSTLRSTTPSGTT